MAKMRTGALRKLHADLGQILADYDASCQLESRDQPGEDNPPEFPGKPAAMDSAHAPDEDPIKAAQDRAARARFGANWTRLSR